MPQLKISRLTPATPRRGSRRCTLGRAPQLAAGTRGQQRRVPAATQKAPGAACGDTGTPRDGQGSSRGCPRTARGAAVGPMGRGGLGEGAAPKDGGTPGHGCAPGDVHVPKMGAVPKDGWGAPQEMGADPKEMGAPQETGVLQEIGAVPENGCSPQEMDVIPKMGAAPKRCAHPKDECSPQRWVHTRRWVQSPKMGAAPMRWVHLSEMGTPLGDKYIPKKVGASPEAGAAPLPQGCSLRILGAGTGSHHCLPVPQSTAASPWSWGRTGPRVGASPGEVDTLLGELAGAVDGVLVGLVFHHLHTLALLALLVAVLADGVQLPHAVLQ